MTMKVYGSRLSPYVARVWLLTLFKGLNQIEFADPPGGMGSADYRRLNPVGKIPALDIGGTIIPESEIICEYLEERFPSPALLPADAAGRAQVRLISRCVDLYVLPPLSGLLPQARRPAAEQDRGLIGEGWQKMRKGLASIDQFMGPGPYALGAAMTLADCALVPAAFLMHQTLPRLGIAAPLDGLTKLGAWWTNIRRDRHAATALDWMEHEIVAFRQRLIAQDAAKRAAG